MIEAYTEGKDLYAMIAAAALGVNYSDCLEFWPEGTEIEIDGKKIIAGHKTHLNKHGKENRNLGKKLNLASTYGMSGATAGKNMGKTAEEGEKLLENFFNDFTGLKLAIDKSKDFLRKNGYVEDFVGRRRRLTDIQLDPYIVMLKNKQVNADFNPILGCEDRKTKDPLILKWENIIKTEIDKNVKRQQYFAAKNGSINKKIKHEISNKRFNELVKEANEDGITLIANTTRIARAERQCFNARVQGSASSLTKIAMVDIENDPILQECDAHLIITVHDEVLVECKAAYADIVEKRLPEVMIAAAKKAGDNIPQACDPYNVTRWYSDTFAATILDDAKKLELSGKSKEQVIDSLVQKYPEFPKNAIVDTITKGCDLEF